MRAGNSDNRHPFSLERVVGKCLECGPSVMSRDSGLPHSMKFSRLLNNLGQRQKLEPSAPALQFAKALYTEYLIMASLGIGRIGIVSHI